MDAYQRGVAQAGREGDTYQQALLLLEGRCTHTGAAPWGLRGLGSTSSRRHAVAAGQELHQVGGEEVIDLEVLGKRLERRTAQQASVLIARGKALEELLSVEGHL